MRMRKTLIPRGVTRKIKMAMFGAPVLVLSESFLHEYILTMSYVYTCQLSCNWPLLLLVVRVLLVTDVKCRLVCLLSD